MLNGVYVPLITPFKDGEVDYEGYKKLVEHYINEGVQGITPLATTGESAVLSDYEYDKLLNLTSEVNNHRVKIFVGHGGNNTRKLIEKLRVIEKAGVDGILSVSPYYSRPDQRGILEHFAAIADSTALDIVLYNIPYRTGRNMENSTILKLAEKKNIIGIKDSCGSSDQSINLLMNRPDDFSILTGEDVFFFSNLALGGQGGVMASAHLNTKKYLEVYNLINTGDLNKALNIWREIYPNIPLLFKEPNPAPLKYVLNSQGLIDSEEVRLPLVIASKELREELKLIIK
ncbi:4-hydroxy-tetrahydrodipicolinate synthase [Clostridium cavendishii DSM 21758]|uniref:4-hydroxy-tetrahydrodipicolinate synthase n=1 Tax=Clostridium cavendishii DSM 21758 TaxID=1121302 RepID=A0A1M6VC24_9CLOT|nr:4-hydroxy-tetrahydrodipicolinate synthase [Clostridium cavendishii]SHK79020.1 4-hydroxy-tetrahydrodipicolinate synthase [Clostridium cavendishii DSM 21758]